jgi:hypothetical protein
VWLGLVIPYFDIFQNFIKLRFPKIAAKKILPERIIMRKIIVLCLVFILAYGGAISEDKSDTTRGWKTGGFLQLNMNQLALVNWAKGGDQSISGVTRVSLFADCHSEDYDWENTMDLGYGLMTSEEYPMRKTEDKIDINTKFGKKAFEKFFYTIIFNLKSQFAPGYKQPDDSTKVSDFFSPAYLILSVGMDYKPSEEFSFYFSPASGRAIVVLDQQLANQGAYGVYKAKYDSLGNMTEEGNNVRFDFGWYFTAKIKKQIMEDVQLRSKLDLFNNYTDKNPGDRLNIDVDWETQLLLKVNKYISANLFLHVIYDHDVDVPIYETKDGEKVKIGEGPRTQFKESIGVGFAYKF